MVNSNRSHAWRPRGRPDQVGPPGDLPRPSSPRATVFRFPAPPDPVGRLLAGPHIRPSPTWQDDDAERGRLNDTAEGASLLTAIAGAALAAGRPYRVSTGSVDTRYRCTNAAPLPCSPPSMAPPRLWRSAWPPTAATAPPAPAPPGPRASAALRTRPPGTPPPPLPGGSARRPAPPAPPPRTTAVGAASPTPRGIGVGGRTPLRRGRSVSPELSPQVGRGVHPDPISNMAQGDRGNT